jgi:hypothetical protein
LGFITPVGTAVNGAEIAASIDPTTGVVTLNTPNAARYLLHGETHTVPLSCASLSSAAPNNLVDDDFKVTFTHECAATFDVAANVDLNSGLPLSGVVANPNQSLMEEIAPATTNNNVLCGGTEVSMVTLRSTSGNANAPPTASFAAGMLTLTPTLPNQAGTWAIDIKTCFVLYPTVCRTDTSSSTYTVADPCVGLTVTAGTITTSPFMTSPLEGSSAITPLPPAFLASISNSVDA